MPGKAILKSQDIDQLVTDFAVVATRFDTLLPQCFRFDSGTSRDGDRGDAWAECDLRVVLLGQALGGLQRLLRRPVDSVTVGRGGEATPTIKTRHSKPGYRVLSKRVAAERKRCDALR